MHCKKCAKEGRHKLLEVHSEQCHVDLETIALGKVRMNGNPHQLHMDLQHKNQGDVLETCKANDCPLWSN